MERLFTSLALIVLAILVIYSPNFLEPIQAQQPSQVLGANTSDQPNPVLDAPQPLHTTSRFESKLETVTEKIAHNVVYKADPDQEIDDNVTLEEGKDGKRTKVYKVLFFEGQEYSRELVSVDVENPQDQIIAKGTKIVWRTLDTSDGQISYWRKLRVWATHYDSHCPGCNEWTAIGMHQGKGVIAVDPSVIKMRSQVYVPGYGKAVAGDTGGAIKGNIIDLGFDDARTAGWQAHFVDIYLLSL